MEAKRLIRPWYLVVLLCAVIVGVIGWWWCCRPVTTVLLVRHAEKAAQTADPPLSPDGHARAQTLVHVAGDASVTAIYATQFLRTQQTVQPLATHLGLPVQQVDANDVEGLVNQVLSDHAGEILLIAGHSNTVPTIVGELGGQPVPLIAEDEFDNLFIATVYRFRRAQVVHLNYGEPD